MWYNNLQVLSKLVSGLGLPLYKTIENHPTTFVKNLIGLERGGDESKFIKSYQSNESLQVSFAVTLKPSCVIIIQISPEAFRWIEWREKQIIILRCRLFERAAPQWKCQVLHAKKVILPHTYLFCSVSSRKRRVVDHWTPFSAICWVQSHDRNSARDTVKRFNEAKLPGPFQI